MNKNNLFKGYIVAWSITVIFVFISCTDELTEYNNPELVFRNSIPIGIPPYTYFNTDRAIHVGGDTSYVYNLTDTIDNKPVFKWDKSMAKFLTAAIFTRPILVENENITNANDIIWQWHNGMEFGENDSIFFTQGKKVMNGIISDITADSLQQGMYYFAVWGWDENGTYIYASSRELKFFVKN